MGVVRFNAGDADIRTGVRVGQEILSGHDPEPTAPGTDSVSALKVDATESYAADEVEYRQPVIPSKVVRLDGCFAYDITDSGFNPHVEGAGLDEGAYPSLWTAPPSVVAHPNATLTLPESVSDVRPGVELALVVGEDTFRGTKDPMAAIGGCTVALDLTAHDLTPGLEGYRMFDNFLPLGPSVKAFKPEAIAASELGVRVNGDIVDTRNLSELRFELSELITYVADILSLRRGDVITLGNPIRGAPELGHGDKIEAWIESLDTIHANIRREDNT
jgi:2-keto-4-pentenoate hydratase/2-oxohepta-3-ene-1,7-dioic acid hydratase in catechol pathway